MNDRLTELHDWLAPIKQIPVIQYDTETITELVSQLRQYSEEVSDLPKGIITVLRLLQHLAIAPIGPEDSGKAALHYFTIEIYKNVMRLLIYDVMFSCLLKPSVNDVHFVLYFQNMVKS